MYRVVHFEISADEPERAQKFYTEVFGWDIQHWPGPEDYWLVTTGPNDQPGINGGIFKRKGPVNYVNTVDVPSIEAAVETIEKNGGKLVVPKRAIPGVGWLAYCQDTEGNVFGITKEDRTAK